MDVEIVLDQADGLSFGEVDIGQLFQYVSIIYSGVAIRDFDKGLWRTSLHITIGHVGWAGIPFRHLRLP